MEKNIKAIGNTLEKLSALLNSDPYDTMKALYDVDLISPTLFHELADYLDEEDLL